MRPLPPVGCTDVAAKRDLDTLGETLRREMADLRTDVGVRAEFHRDVSTLTRTIVFSLVTAVVAVASLAFAAARLV